MGNYIDMTNEEIWKMLEKKMEKNNILSEPGVLCQGENKLNKLLDPKIIEDKYVTDVYDATVARYAIVLAYCSGYLRAMKGQPFKIGEKKKKGGHWEPVDPNNLPKEGTRVRYARECTGYGNNMVKLGDEGVVKWDGVCNLVWFGVKFDNPRSRMKWLCFDEEEKCLDAWVEDDE